MLDNTEHIRKLLNFEDGLFYFIQILKRRKENPTLHKNSQNIDNFFISSMEKFEKALPHIKHLCDTNNARAYIRLNRRNAEKVANLSVQVSLDYMFNKHFHLVKTAYLSAAGDKKVTPDKFWILDIDGDLDGGLKVVKVINATVTYPKGQVVYPYVATIPTVNGAHVITTGFDTREFVKEFPDVSIHKDNPTVLYAP